jgi:hypothetical protein
MASLSDMILSSGGWIPTVSLFLVTICFVALHRRCSMLDDIPGPFFAAFTRLWHVRHIIIGDQNLQLVKLHKELGKKATNAFMDKEESDRVSRTLCARIIQ